jgi:hypothetical protein
LVLSVVSLFTMEKNRNTRRDFKVTFSRWHSIHMSIHSNKHRSVIHSRNWLYAQMSGNTPLLCRALLTLLLWTVRPPLMKCLSDCLSDCLSVCPTVCPPPLMKLLSSSHEPFVHADERQPC